MQGHEPFRCLGCGMPSISATRCLRCGGRSFELLPANAAALGLSRPRARRLAAVGAPAPEEPSGKVVPIHRAHALRSARRARAVR